MIPGKDEVMNGKERKMFISIRVCKKRRKEKLEGEGQKWRKKEQRTDWQKKHQETLDVWTEDVK